MPNVDLARGSYFRDLGQPYPPQAGGDPDIRRLQERLQSEGFDSGPIDGIDGPRTQAALAARRQQEQANTANTPPIPRLRPDVPLPGLRPDQTQPLPRLRPAVDRPLGNKLAPVPAAAATAAVPPISAQPNLNPTTIGTLYSQNYEAGLREAGVGRAESAVPTYGRLHHGSYGRLHHGSVMAGVGLGGVTHRRCHQQVGSAWPEHNFDSPVTPGPRGSADAVTALDLGKLS